MINNLQAPDKSIREGWWTALYNENNVKKMDNDPFEMHFVPGYETIYTSGSWNHLLPSDEWFPDSCRTPQEHGNVETSNGKRRAMDTSSLV